MHRARYVSGYSHFYLKDKLLHESGYSRLRLIRYFHVISLILHDDNPANHITR